MSTNRLKVGDIVTMCYWEKPFKYKVFGSAGYKEDRYEERQVVLEEPLPHMKDRQDPTGKAKNAAFRVEGKHFAENGVCIDNVENEDPWVYWIKEMDSESSYNFRHTQQS